MRQFFAKLEKRQFLPIEAPFGSKTSAEVCIFDFMGGIHTDNPLMHH